MLNYKSKEDASEVLGDCIVNVSKKGRIVDTEFRK